MTFALAFPAFDPVLVQFGPFAIRWYALAYIGGLILGWQYVKWLVHR
ncbi:MAG: prolipoprotein diacylglyceryl transferase, partial [Geminicoccaceae bacterium]|nr:prolipoprotein diacylglyceryl transferase [Geminicoccaceae bacterium]